MDGLIPWKKLEKQLAKKYSNGKAGRKPYPLSVMLSVHVMQRRNLSGPAMEDALCEIKSMRRFAGLRLSDNLPDETTILNFVISLKNINSVNDSSIPFRHTLLHRT